MTHSKKVTLSDGATFEMINEDGPENPREIWDCATEIIAYHRDYGIGDKGSKDYNRDLFASLRGRYILWAMLQGWTPEEDDEGDGECETCAKVANGENERDWFIRTENDRVYCSSCLDLDTPPVTDSTKALHYLIDYSDRRFGVVYSEKKSCISKETAFIWPIDFTERSEESLSICEIDDHDCCGFIFLPKKWVDENYPNGLTLEKAQEIVEAELKTYNQWACNDVWGYVLTPPPIAEPHCGTCECKVEEEESCWGFYGSDIEENGILESLPEKYREELKNFSVWS